MGYLIFQILVWMILAGVLCFVIGWLLRGSRFQTELQNLDGRWRTKLGEVESERDRFAGEVTQANDAKAKLDAEVKRLSGAQDSGIQQAKREQQARIDELGKELAKAKQSGGDAGRLGKELAAASERAASLEASLKDAKAANATCKSEVDRLKAELADLKRSGGAGAASSGGALGLVSSTGSSTAATGGNGGGQSGGSDTSYTQRAAAPSHLAEVGGQSFSRGGKGASSDDDNEGEKPAALTAARGGQADDLKKISGVGPKLEKTLNGLGIFHFSQIAEFTADNVAWVDRHLRFKGRIARENWIEQAKVLAAGGETEFSKRK